LFVMGIDVGTQGARAVVSDLHGRVLADAVSAFAVTELAAPRPGYFEQDPRHWREAAFDAIAAAVGRFQQSGHTAGEIAALSVTSTSGTMCLVDERGEPIGSAIMYSDARSSGVAEQVQAAGAAIADKLGTRFNASFALSKVCWVRLHESERLAQARWFLSPTDLVIGWLSGEWGVTDWTNALKWGYDVADLRWPAFIARTLDLPVEYFPRVQAPGTVIGEVASHAVARTGLGVHTRVVAGATDGTASQMASGAAMPGDWNSTLGTTLVLKGVSTTLLKDPQGRLYCHRHADSMGSQALWLPGGASSTGGDCLAQRFAADRLEHLNASALALSPTDLLIYPLVRRGERLPFLNADATGFALGEAANEEVFYAAHLEGLAYVERLCYQVVESLGAPVGDVLYVAGGGTHSAAGLQIRADVLDKQLLVPDVPLGAMGAAILAARGCAYGSVAEAVNKMVHCHQRVDPRSELHVAYGESYARFVTACRERGYLP
jgi:sugar (pentulose or hexulose) kinase